MASVSTVVVIPKNLAISAKSANYKSWEEKLLQEDTIKRCKRDFFKNNQMQLPQEREENNWLFHQSFLKKKA